MRFRAFYFVFAACLILGAAAGLGLAGEHFRIRLAATVAGAEQVKEYLDEISRLREEKGYQEEQVKVIARELGVLQARLDRFDVIGEKLFTDEVIGAHLGDEDILDGGKGGADLSEDEFLPDLEDIKLQIGLLTARADKTEQAMDAGLAFSVKNSSKNAGAPHLWPVMHKNAWPSSRFGWRQNPFNKKKRSWHSGLDIAAGFDAPIVASGDGVVVFSGYRYMYGILVEIRHANGFSTRYAHMKAASVKNGQHVKAGELVGLMGSTGRSTGPHLHIEVLKGDEKLDPYPFVIGSRKRVRAMAEKGEGAARVAAWKAQQEVVKDELVQLQKEASAQK